MSDMDNCRRLLETQMAVIGVEANASQLEQLMAYLALLVKWNKAYNLTAVREPEAMVSRHLIDSLSVLPWIGEGRLLDVGSGPGLPGIPLAIMRPDLAVTTLDSNGKKTRFQQQVKAELKLGNLQVEHCRVEQLNVEPFTQIISRAFASLHDMLTLTAHLATANGVFLAMKGLYPEAELQQLPDGFELQSAHSLHLPQTEGERHLLLLGRV